MALFTRLLFVIVTHAAPRAADDGDVYYAMPILPFTPLLYQRLTASAC